MDKLIRFDDVIKAIKKTPIVKAEFNGYMQTFICPGVAESIIKGIPAVDAVEVVHGRWKPVDHDGSWRVDMCSVCHRRMHYVDYDQPYQYCPNCGAKMDGESR